MSAICAGRRVSHGGGEPSGHCAHARLATKQIASTGAKTRVRFTRRTYYRWRSLGTNATNPEGSNSKCGVISGVPRQHFQAPPVWRRRVGLKVAPGERWDVIVNCTNPGTWAFHCHILPHAESEHGMFGMVTALVVQK